MTYEILQAISKIRWRHTSWLITPTYIIYAREKLVFIKLSAHNLKLLKDYIKKKRKPSLILNFGWPKRRNLPHSSVVQTYAAPQSYLTFRNTTFTKTNLKCITEISKTKTDTKASIVNLNYKIAASVSSNATVELMQHTNALIL